MWKKQQLFLANIPVRNCLCKKRWPDKEDLKGKTGESTWKFFTSKISNASFRQQRHNVRFRQFRNPLATSLGTVFDENIVFLMKMCR